MKKITFLITLVFYSLTFYSQDVTTLAGSTLGFLDATGASARFSQPSGICYDGNGNLYVADQNNHRIRKIAISSGAVTTVAGSTAGYTDDTGALAKFSSPYAICYDGSANLFVADYGNNVIRKIEIASGNVTTLAGGNINTGYANGIGVAAAFTGPSGICTDNIGNLYVADSGNDRIRKIEISTATVTTLAGSSYAFADGIGTAARFRSPFGICYDGLGNLYVADRVNYKIRKIEISTATVTTLAGSTAGFSDGSANNAQFNLPAALCTDGLGNIYVSDNSNHRIRKIEIASGNVSTLAGSSSGFSDGPATSARFQNPIGICPDTNGNLYIADLLNHKIRKITGAFLGVNINNIEEVKIYPNPVSNHLTIETPFISNLQLTVINQLGQQVLKQNQNEPLKSLDVSNLSKGLYFLNITTEENSQTIKFIKN